MAWLDAWGRKAWKISGEVKVEKISDELFLLVLLSVKEAMQVLHEGKKD